MKKLFLFAASTLMMLGSCSQDEMMNAPQSNEDGKMAIVASIEGQPNSRVTESQGTLSWEADDWFTVFSDNGVKFITDATNAPLGKFTPEEDVTLDDNSYAVYYPVDNAFSLTNAELTVNLAASYSSGASIKAPMWGTYADGSISFKHLCGALKVAYSEIPTGYTTLVVEASKPINGTFTATLSAGEPVLATTAQASETNKKVTVTITDNQDGVFYVPLPADTYDLKVYAQKGNDIIELKSWSNLNIARKGLYQTTATYVAVPQSLSTPAAVSSAIANIGDNSVVDIEGTIDATTSEAGSMTLPDKNATYNFAETPTTSAEKPLTFEEATGSDGAKVNINMPSEATGLHAVINTPNSTVNIDGGTYESLTATTATNTLIIGEGVTIKSLNIKGGNVIVYGQVDKISSEVATTIKLENDITLTAPVRIGKKVTIDLNGHSITSSTEWPTENTKDAMFIVNRNGVLTIDDSSTEKSGSIIANSEELSCAIKLTEKADDLDATNYAKVVLNAGTLDGNNVVTYGIGGNGNPGRGNTNVEMNDGKINGFDYGIFNPQENGSVTIKNGVIATKKAAIEMRSGNLEIIDGEFSATITPEDANPNGNGTTIEGAAIAISQHTTNHDLSATIKGGTFKGIYALYEEDLQDEQVENISLSVIGGTFNGKVYSENCESFISGGTFNDGSVFGDNYFATSANITLGANITIAPNTVIPTGVTIDGSTQKYSVNTTIEADDASTGIGKGVFNLAGGTIKNITFESKNTQYDIIVTAGGSVIEGCNFPTATIEAMGKGKRAIFTDSTIELSDDLTVKSCTFDDKVYAFNFSNANNKMDIIFEGCTLGGWLSGHGKSHTFTNCTFTKSGDYANYIPYCPATFNGCSFDEGFAISLKKGSTYTFIGTCTYAGNNITEPGNMNWDFSGGTTGTGDNDTSETVVIGEQSWTNSVPEGTGGEEATPIWEN